MSLLHLGALLGGDINLVKLHNDDIENGEMRTANETAWGADYFDEDDTTAPTGATNGIKLPSLSNRVTVIVKSGTRTAATFVVWGYCRAAACWVSLEPTQTFGIGVANASNIIQCSLASTGAANLAVPFELAGAYSRLMVEHITASGGAKSATYYALGG
ncbi:MAG: hypothetical protein GY700_06325 [Propionibacteriaceae bacterium]|nr:hypothetical protein [Propionibacteriaceae bacterium]